MSEILDNCLKLILFIYEFASIAIYIRILYILLRTPKPTLRSSFWTIFAYIAMTDLFIFFLHLGLYDLPMLNFQAFFANLNSPSAWIGFAMFANFLMLYVQFANHCLLALNRFTIVQFPTRHNSFWEGKLRWIQAGTVVGAFLLTFPRLFTDGQFVALNAQNPAMGFFASPSRQFLFSEYQTLLTVIVSITSAVICLILNLLTLMMIIRYRHATKNSIQVLTLNHNNGHGKVEIGLFLFAFWTMLTQLSMAVIELLFFLIKNHLCCEENGEQIFSSIFTMTWYYGFYALSQPWIVLIVSRDLRRAIFKFKFIQTGST